MTFRSSGKGRKPRPEVRPCQELVLEWDGSRQAALPISVALLERTIAVLDQAADQLARWGDVPPEGVTAGQEARESARTMARLYLGLPRRG